MARRRPWGPFLDVEHDLPYNGRVKRKPAHLLTTCVVAAGFLALTACGNTQALGGPGPGLRYCKRPGGPGNYLAASPNVSCTTARKVEVKVFSQSCIKRTRCYAYGFKCLAFWDGRYDRPFSYTSHAICRAGARRVEMDEG
jgi:hypothetical protein